MAECIREVHITSPERDELSHILPVHVHQVTGDGIVGRLNGGALVNPFCSIRNQKKSIFLINFSLTTSKKIVEYFQTYMFHSCTCGLLWAYVVSLFLLQSYGASCCIAFGGNSER